MLDQLLGGTEETYRGVDWRVMELQRYIDRHEGKVGRSLCRVCEELDLGISGHYAARLFRECIGIGAREYAKRKRLRGAIQRLYNTSLSVKEIAADLGYQNIRKFSRTFRQELCLNPTEFRKMPINDSDGRMDYKRIGSRVRLV